MSRFNAGNFPVRSAADAAKGGTREEMKNRAFALKNYLAARRRVEEAERKRAEDYLISQGLTIIPVD